MPVPSQLRAVRRLTASAGRRAVDYCLASVDPETGLPGRRRLEAALGDGHAPGVVQLVALNGGDGARLAWDRADAQLPRRVGKSLVATACALDARAYRVDASMFAIVGGPSLGDGAAVAALLAAVSAAAGPHAAVLHGEARLPEDGTGAAALDAALNRMRVRARRQSESTERQVRDVLLALLDERRARASRAMPRVASDAVAVGHRLGLSLGQLDDVVRAAELQDVGKLLLPESILGKQGPLSDTEWEVVRTHPAIAERVIAAAPALAPVAKIVRSCSERWDGTGYPDGLQGEEIPIGARIIAVCVAFDAMTTPRPYRDVLAPAQALLEICRCAERQFDPAVVSAFCATLEVSDEYDAAEPAAA